MSSGSLKLDDVLDQADLVIVHEWNAHELVRRIGEHRARGKSYVLLSTVVHANRIIVLKEGKISEMGTHVELMRGELVNDKPAV